MFCTVLFITLVLIQRSHLLTFVESTTECNYSLRPVSSAGKELLN